MKRDSQGRFVSQKSQVAQPKQVVSTESNPVKQIATLARGLVSLVGVGVAETVERKLYEQFKNSAVYQNNKASLLALYTQLGMTGMAQTVANDMMA
jgi:hypothetical protein